MYIVLTRASNFPIFFSFPGKGNYGNMVFITGNSQEMHFTNRIISQNIYKNTTHYFISHTTTTKFIDFNNILLENIASRNGEFVHFKGFYSVKISREWRILFPGNGNGFMSVLSHIDSKLTKLIQCLSMAQLANWYEYFSKISRSLKYISLKILLIVFIQTLLCW